MDWKTRQEILALAERQQPGLTRNERGVMGIVHYCCLHGLEMLKADDIHDLLDVEGGGTSADLLSRLERKGHVKVLRYQRSRQVQLTEEGHKLKGRWTREPRNKTPHWRQIKDRPLPTVAIRQVESNDVDLAAFILKEATLRGKSPPDMIQMLLKIGATELMAEMQDRAA